MTLSKGQWERERIHEYTPMVKYFLLLFADLTHTHNQQGSAIVCLSDHTEEPLERPCAIDISFSKTRLSPFFFHSAAGDYSISNNVIRRDGELYCIHRIESYWRIVQKCVPYANIWCEKKGKVTKYTERKREKQREKQKNKRKLQKRERKWTDIQRSMIKFNRWWWVIQLHFPFLCLTVCHDTPCYGQIESSTQDSCNLVFCCTIVTSYIEYSTNGCRLCSMF